MTVQAPVVVAVVVALAVVESIVAGAATAALGRLAFLPAGRFRQAATDRLVRLLVPARTPGDPERVATSEVVLVSAAAGRPAVLRLVRRDWLQPPVGGLVRLDAEIVGDEVLVRARLLPMPLLALLGLPIAVALTAPRTFLESALFVLVIGQLLMLLLAVLRARRSTEHVLRSLSS